MADPVKEKVIIGDQTLLLGDCLEILPTLEQPSPLKHIDSVTMPNTYIDPDLLQGFKWRWGYEAGYRGAG